MKERITLKPGEHRGEAVVLLQFEKNFELIGAVKALGTARWSGTKQCWYIPSAEFNLSRVFDALKPYAFLDYSAMSGGKTNEKAPATEAKPSSLSRNAILPPLSTQQQSKIDRFREWMLQKRYSDNSIKTYTDAIGVFLRFYTDRDPATLNNDDLVHFNSRYIIANNYSASYQNQVVNAIRLFFGKLYKTSMDIKNLERPKRGRKLPKVIDKSVMESMLVGIPNLKHKTALTLIYALGLRRSEMIRLRLEDIDLRRKALTVRNGKGMKDRTLPLSDKLVNKISEYISVMAPEVYLIEGQFKGTAYSATSLEKIFHKYLGKVLKNHNFTLHCLRHSFCTHLLEAGVDLRYIQELVGHKSSKTTEIYTWVSMKNLRNIKNPTDDFDL